MAIDKPKILEGITFNLKYSNSVELEEDSDRFSSLTLTPPFELNVEQKIDLEVLYGDLYGHFTFLETALNGNLYNYQNYGANTLAKLSGQTFKTVLPRDIAIYPSSVYQQRASLGNSLARFVDSIPFESYSGVTFVINRLITVYDNTVRNIISASRIRGITLTHNPQTEIWNLTTFNGTKTGTLEPDYSLDASKAHSLALVIEVGNPEARLFLNGKLSVRFKFTNAVSAMVNDSPSIGSSNNKEAFSAVQVWKKALSAEEVAALHPNGVRSPLRSANPKDFLIAKTRQDLLWVDPVESNHYLYSARPDTDPIPTLIQENAQRPRMDFEGNVLAELPIVNSGYLTFDGSRGVELNTAPHTGKFFESLYPEYVFLVLRKQQPQTNSEFIFYHGGSDLIQAYYAGFSSNLTSLFIVENFGNGQVRQRNILIPNGFFGEEFHEICIVYSSGRVYIDGQAIDPAETFNYSAERIEYRSTVLGGQYSRLQGFSGAYGFIPNLKADLKMVFSVDSLNLLDSNSYTQQNTEQFKIARLFYQMGFKRSLTNLEPNNLRLLAGDYPI